MATLADTLKKQTVRGPGGQLSETTPEELQSLTDKAGLQAPPLTPLGGAMIGANPDQQKMIIRKAQKLAASKKYYHNNIARIRLYNKALYQRQKEIKLKQAKEYYLLNKTRIREVQSLYAKNNRTSINIRKIERLSIDINLIIKEKIRSRIKSAIKRNSKASSSFQFLGCNIAFLKQYLEEQFKPGMTWANYSLNEWHIDHIIPISWFDMSNSEEQFKAFNYINLQPLWAKDNLYKGNRIV